MTNSKLEQISQRSLMGRKHCWKGRQSWILAFPPFPTISSKAFFFGLFNSSPNNKFLDWSKSIPFVDNKTNVPQKLKFVLEGIENIVGKGENAGYHNGLKSFFFRVIKSCDCVVKS